MCDCNFHCLSCKYFKYLKEKLNFDVSIDEFGKVHVKNDNYEEKIEHIVSLNAIKLLCHLFSCEGEIKKRHDIESFVWSNTNVGVNSLPVLLHDVRKMLASTEYSIITIRGVGYMAMKRR
ncbi:winged helix-turn-helix domain-containing protein [Vibrio brasiliensis]|uniref:winged helix-turn-helix domain-containing protein n=1 Tax=Vibrio brasiliensis TaxID=170652 RepID=UPI003CE560F2